MGGVTYDTGALLAAERNDRRMWSVHANLLDDGVVPVIPAPVLAEAWRGGARQANLSRLLRLCLIEAMTEEVARAVGVICGRAGHDDVVDGAVVESAVRRANSVVTSNEGDIRRIADAIRATLLIRQI